jgi:hypothetical protein
LFPNLATWEVGPVETAHSARLVSAVFLDSTRKSMILVSDVESDRERERVREIGRE